MFRLSRLSPILPLVQCWQQTLARALPAILEQSMAGGNVVKRLAILMTHFLKQCTLPLKSPRHYCSDSWSNVIERSIVFSSIDNTHSSHSNAVQERADPIQAFKSHANGRKGFFLAFAVKTPRAPFRLQRYGIHATPPKSISELVQPWQRGTIISPRTRPEHLGRCGCARPRDRIEVLRSGLFSPEMLTAKHEGCLLRGQICQWVECVCFQREGINKGVRSYSKKVTQRFAMS
jgi:hypothetical protein